MKKNILLKILSILTLSSCSCNGCRVIVYQCNTWIDFNSKEHNYYDCKMNLSLYLDQDYFVFGVILGENTTCTIHFKFESNEIYNSSNNIYSPLNYEEVIYTDSTGEKINFNGPVGYTIKSSRTIKFDYSSWDEETKNTFNNSKSFKFDIYSDGFSYSESDQLKGTDKVDFGDDLSKVKK